MRAWLHVDQHAKPLKAAFEPAEPSQTTLSVLAAAEGAERQQLVRASFELLTAALI